jgi:uncharacterized protein
MNPPDPLIALRRVRDADLPALLALNETELPHVNSVPLALFEQFAVEAAYFGVACAVDRPVGFLIGLTPEVEYASLNFQWFRRHYDDFYYIDRVAVLPDWRRHGIGRRLYQDLEQQLTGRVAQLTCEVNLRPRNEASLRFHTRLGFQPVGTQETDDGAKTVQLLAKPLADRER